MSGLLRDSTISTITEDVRWEVRCHVGGAVIRFGELIAGLGSRIDQSGLMTTAGTKAFLEGYEAARSAA